jgi:hypothetical protein
MRVRGTAALALIAILLATLSGGALALGAPRGQGGAPIRLKAATFDPSAGESARAPITLVRRGPPAEGPGYYIVQARGPVDQGWKDAIAAVGVELLGYIPENAFKARMSAEQAAQVRQLGITSYVGLFHPFYALSPRLAATGQQLVTVQLEQGGSRAAVEAMVAAAGATLVAVEGERLIVAGDRSQIEGVALAMDVAWIEPHVLNEKHNEYGGGTIIGGATANASGYDGSTQIAAVADTGIGGGTAASAHRDIPSTRVVAVQNFPGVTDSCFQQIVNDGAVDVDSGHGTHVAGSVLSGGDPGGFGKGVAPAARLVFQATENYVITSNFCKTFYGYQNDYYLTGLNNLSSVFQQAYGAGARIHANSWGAPVAGDYNANSVTTDQFIWANRDMTITFSAGNSGVDANNNGVVDNDSIGSPATAKNVITIGASENDRQGNYQCDPALTYISNDTTFQSGQTCSSMGDSNLLGTPRQRWGFTTNPIADDPTAGNAQQMAAFSSRGPTDDGRIKPDVVAPGTWILSTYSSQHRQGYGDPANPQNGAYQADGWGIARNGYYKYFGGTSMSNPIAAGAATVVRDFYQKTDGHGASAALVKATLINSAVDLLDENNDGANDNDFPIPNAHEGWGRIDLSAATDGTAIYIDNTSGLSTGAAYSAAYSAAGGPLKVTLVWSDYPSTAAAAANLVNNLNLTVSGPGGVIYRGNVFSGGWSGTGGSADTLNNVENVFIQAPAAGSYTVQVSGANVPQGPQPFALVVRGATVAAPTAPAAPSGLTASAASSSQINLSWADNSGNEDGFAIERCQGAGCSNFAEIASVGAGSTSYPNTGLSASTSYSYRVRAFNAAGYSGYSNTATATTSGAATNTGLLSSTANAAVTSGAGDNNGYQSSPANAHGDGGGLAVDTNSGSNRNTSCTNSGKDKHDFRDYGISVPGGATISGIEVRLDARADATSGSPRICVQLSWDGGASWTSALQTGTLTTGEASYTLGGASSTWGRTWSSGELSNANFRVRVINVASNTSRDFSLDWLAVRVTYQ